MDAEEEASFMKAQELLTAHIVSMTLKAAMDLGVIDALTAAPLTAEELVARAQLPRPPENKDQATAAVDRMLGFLASYGVVTCSSSSTAGAVLRRRYAKGPICRWLSTTTNNSNGGEGSLAALATFSFQQAFFNPWHHMADAVLSSGSAFEMANGMPPFEFMGKNPQLSAMYNRSMSQLSSIAARKMLDRFPAGGFDDIQVLVDVGGGAGTTLGMITSRYKHIRGINFDLPFVIGQAKPIPGVEHVGGNMFDSVPSGDAIFMKSVLHMLNDETCVKLLMNCHRSVPEKGKVVVMEFVLPASPDATQAGRFPFHMDMTCLLSGFKGGGGRERTEQEYERLATDAGFHGPIRSTSVFGGYNVLEFTK